MMKRLTMLFVMLLGVVTMTFADNVKDGVNSVKETATAVTETVNEIAKVVTNTVGVVNETTKTVKAQTKEFKKTTGVSVTDGKTAKIEKVKSVKTSDKEIVKEDAIENTSVDVSTATSNVEKFMDRFEKYGTDLKNMIVDIFEYSKQPAKDLFNLFVWKVRIYGLVDLGLMLLFIGLTIMFGKFMWKGIKIMSRRAIQKKKTTFHILLATILNFTLGVLFLIMSLSYVKDTKQIMMDSFVPQYQAIKDVAVVFGTATGSEKTKEVAESMTK